MATRIRRYQGKDPDKESIYEPTEKELLYNIENWRRIADAAPTPCKRRYALGKAEKIELRLLHFCERQEMRDDAGPEVALEPGYKFPTMAKGKGGKG